MVVHRICAFMDCTNPQPCQRIKKTARSTYRNFASKLTMNHIKTLFNEAMENPLVAASFMFLIIAFLAAMAEPKAALFPLALGVLAYIAAVYFDKKDN